MGSSLTELVGNTPVVKLAKVVPEGAADVFVKLEWFNPTGSYNLGSDLGGRAGRPQGRRDRGRVVPPLLDESLYHKVKAIDEGEARVMARRLTTEEGLLAGTSSALNVVGAIGLARELGPGTPVATVAVDTGLKYLMGDLFGV